MKRKFRKYHKINISNYLVILIILICGYIGLKKVKLVNNDYFISNILKNTDANIKYDYNKINILDMVMSIEQPLNKDISNVKINYFARTTPIVYIYNTHDSEGYLSDYKEGYNLDPNIVSASKMLQDELNKRGILTIVEERSVSAECSRRGYIFTQSYSISREYVEEVLDKYPNLRLIIDLHRDAVDRDYTYITYDNKNYAKTLFVMGKRYNNYDKNLALATKIDNSIKKRISSISRGIMINDVDGHNGIYNQDLNTNMVLLELGSNNNTIDEVYNTIIILADAIEEVINESKT